MIAILGAGPCGLGAAFRLKEAGFSDFELFEAAEDAGGLASSFIDREGFTWDIGGHVQFSHYEDFDRVMDLALPDQYYYHQRESWVWLKERFIPYPFQLNLHRLPKELQAECVEGLKNLKPQEKPQNFEDWILQSFGSGIARIFMTPYNYKVWAYPLNRLDFQWIGERVAQVDLKRVEKNIESARDDVSWGPNSTFRYPKMGGTGAIWKAVAKLIGDQKIQYGKKLIKIDLQNSVLYFQDGSQRNFSKLLSTMPIDRCAQLAGLSSDPNLLSSNSHIVGIGIRGPLPEELQTKCWMYFPESNCPFYRVTVFSNYSPAHVPNSKTDWSLMCETSESPEKPLRRERLIEDSIQGLKNVGLLSPDQKIISRWHYVAEPGYPTPFIGRDTAVKELRAKLETHQVFSRGRFGLWKYEVSNQDHTFMQGFEWADRILFDSPEETAEQPNLVNRGGRMPLRPLKKFSYSQKEI